MLIHFALPNNNMYSLFYFNFTLKLNLISILFSNGTTSNDSFLQKNYFLEILFSISVSKKRIYSELI